MRARGPVLVAALLLASGCGGEPETADVPTLEVRGAAERTAYETFRRAERLLAADAPSEAEPLLRQALELDPGLDEARRLLARVLVEQRRYGDALPVLRALLREHPRDASLHASLTECLHVLGDLPAAEAAYAAWIDVDPTSDEAHFGLGQVLYDLGRYEDAVKSFRRAEKRRAGRADVRSELGLALQALGQLEEAEAKQRDALERDPRSAEAWYRLGDVVSRGGAARRDEAIDAMQRAVRLDPRHVHAHLYLYRLLRQSVLAGRADLADEAERHWRTVLRLHGPQQLGRRAGAPRVDDVGERRERRLRERLAAAPDDAAARRALAYLLHADGAIDEATAEYDALIAGGADDPELLAAAGAATLAAGRAVRAVELLERACAADGAGAAPRRHLAWALLLADRPEDALRVLDALLADAADDALAQRARGLALMRVDQLDAGLQAIAAAGWLR